MSAVVLRCQTCGTTQNQPGECDACSEGEVRYFCSNHTPGLWLDGVQCRTCGAKFGDSPRVKHRAPSPDPAPSVPPLTLEPMARPRGGRTAPPRPSPSPKRAPEVPAPAPRKGPPDLVELVKRAMHARREHARTAEERPRAAPPSRMPGLRIGGCIAKLMLLIFIFFVVSLMGSFLLFM